MAEEWGPWIEHDGMGCPCVGFMVQGEYRSGLVDEWLAGTELSGPVSSYRIVGPLVVARSQWHWGCAENEVPSRFHIMRYRIRKPRGMAVLEEIARGVRAPQGVDA